MKTYSITCYTDPYHGSRAAGFKMVNRTTYAKTLQAGLTLKEAQSELLAMFCEDAGRKVANWGAATRLKSIQGLEAYPTHLNGRTRAYSEDVWVYRIDEEQDTMYTMKDWERDGELKPTIGQPVAEQIVREMRNCVPPTTNTPDLMQCGEMWDHDYKTGKPLYTTFARTEQGWIYCGNCLKDKTAHRAGYIETLFPPKR